MHTAPVAPLLVPAIPRIRSNVPARLGRAGRDAIAAGLIVCLGVALAHAEVALQDWIPDVLAMPADAEVVTDREIGSTVRMFSLSTDEDVGPLLASWEEALRNGGYSIERDTEELVEGAIEFSGPGISNAKIVANRTAEDGETLIEFDATLN